MTIWSERPGPLDRLRAVPVLRGATRKDLLRIDRLTDEVDVDAGRVVTREGERSHGFFLILSGTAVVTVEGVECAVLGPGMFFGLAAVVDGAPEPATVTTLSAMRLRVATWHAFGELCEVEPVARALRQILAVLLRDAYRSGTMQRVAPRVEIREAG